MKPSPSRPLEPPPGKPRRVTLAGALIWFLRRLILSAALLLALSLLVADGHLAYLCVGLAHATAMLPVLYPKHAALGGKAAGFACIFLLEVALWPGSVLGRRRRG